MERRGIDLKVFQGVGIQGQGSGGSNLGHEHAFVLDVHSR